MRLSGVNASILNYMNGGNSSFLNSLYGTRANRYGNSYHLYGSYGKNTGKYSSVTGYYEKMAYSKIKTGAKGIRSHSETLSQTGQESLFAKAEETGNTKDIRKEINNFVEDYNAMLSNMKKAGGSIQNMYAKQFSTQTMIHKEELGKLGITALADGSLSVDQKVLENAGIDDMKKVFWGTSSFAGKVSMKSIYVESNAVSNLSDSTYASYNSLGGYGNYKTYGGYSANSFGSLFHSYFDSYF